ncbi:MAG: 2-hydroxyglutaryl-CoA dehydratase [Desulfobacteraceae bacterium]|nr:MAG: 2-hydroxyglutaryl-CoA dehydratase [Desulfobacteraceae bacterium]
MTIVLGIDLGSALTKGILLQDRKILDSYICPSGGHFANTAQQVKNKLLTRSGLNPSDPAYTVATGYGSKAVSFANEIVTDITAHGRGLHFLFPDVRTIVDVGDLYSKAIRIDNQGNIMSFLLSGKCAGGSGRILKVMAKVLQVPVEELGALSLKSQKKVNFNTGCAVFAESEAISRIAEGNAKEDLLAAINRALAAQIQSLAERLGLEKDYALTGGGACNPGLAKALTELSGLTISVPPEPLLTAALGAALIANQKK